MKIIKNKDFLKIPCKPCVNMERNNEISAVLLSSLKEFGGVGLACNQIGINDVCVCVINVKDPIVLINPKITKKSEEKVIYAEQCLSIPGKLVSTIRHTSITVTADNLANERTFSRDFELTHDNAVKDQGLLECVCVQHEIDHLNGKLIIDKDVRFVMEARSKIKFGRNDKVLIQKDDETKQIKYKTLYEHEEQGWKMI